MKKRSSLAGYLVPRIEGMTIERESKIIERLLDSGIIDHEKSVSISHPALITFFYNYSVIPSRRIFDRKLFEHVIGTLQTR